MLSVLGTFSPPPIFYELELPYVDALINTLQYYRKERDRDASKHVNLVIHNFGLEAHRAVGNHLVPMLAECGCLLAAEQVFQKLVSPNEHAWTSLIHCYSLCEDRRKQAFSLYQAMQRQDSSPSSYTFLALMKVCMELDTPDVGQKLHLDIVNEALETDSYVGSALVDMYCHFGMIAEARDVFDALHFRDVVLWTLLINTYIEYERPVEALKCLDRMEADGVAMDVVSYICRLKACSYVGNVDKGLEIHATLIQYGFEDNTFVGNALIDMYAKCDLLHEALVVFDVQLNRDVVTWNTLITMYSEQGLEEEVLMCLDNMVMEGVSPNSVTFVCTLQVFYTVPNQKGVQVVYMKAVKHGNENDCALMNSLLECYSRSGCLSEAHDVFERINFKDTVPWTSLLTGFMHNGFNDEALDLFDNMKFDNITFDAVMLICVLQACSNVRDLNKGFEVHICILKVGFESYSNIGNTLVDMYSKCGSLEEAQKVFYNLKTSSIVSWNALLAGYAQQEFSEQVLGFLEDIKMAGLSPNDVTYISCLKACICMKDKHRGQKLHMEIAKKGFERQLLVGTTLVDLYAECRSFIEARKVFDDLPEKNVVSWSVIITSYIDNGLYQEAWEAIKEMQTNGVSPNHVIYINILKLCSKVGLIDEGLTTHVNIVLEELDKDDDINITLVSMYARFGFKEEAQETLENGTFQDTRIWNALITGYSERDMSNEVLDSFLIMECKGIPHDLITYTCCLKACSKLGSISLGQLFHSRAVNSGFEDDLNLVYSLVDMYAQCGLFNDAQELCGRSLGSNSQNWNALLAGYNSHGLFEETLRSFREIQSIGVVPDATTFVSILKACCGMGFIDTGHAVYDDIIREGYEGHFSIVHNLLELYSSSGFFMEALDILEEQSIEESILWNVLISEYTKHGYGEEVLNVLHKMECQGILPDVVTYICCLKACSIIGAIDKGRQIHIMVVEEELDIENTVGNTIVDMYSKCGLLIEAQDVFDDLLDRDVVSWSILISGYACHGKYRYVFELFERMKDEDVKPDNIVYLGVLSVCCHAGFIDIGQNYFMLMSETGISNIVEHCNCMIDLFSRAGQLEEAIAMVDKMPCLPDVVTWTTLLSACRKWDKLDLGRDAFRSAVSLETDESSAFVLMSNIFVGVK